MKKFEFKKAYEEIEVAGKVFKMDLSDESIIEYQEALMHYYKEAEKAEAVDFINMTVDQQKYLYEEQHAMLKDILELFLGEESFDYIYNAAGKSTSNMMDFIIYLGEVFTNKAQETKAEVAEKYTGTEVKKYQRKQR